MSTVSISTDETEIPRIGRCIELSREATTERQDLEERHGQVWTTEELQADFAVMGFLAPMVVVRRRSDDALGSLEFQARPRFYFNWVSD